MYVPSEVVTNDDLTKVMDTSDSWIQERTGIKERRFAKRYEDTTTTMGVEAAKIAMERAGVRAQDIDFVVFATLSPDYYFPGCGVLLQRTLKMNEIGALDIRNQCSGFIYALSVADQFIKTGMYKNILLVASETHSYGLDFSTRGRNGGRRPGNDRRRSVQTFSKARRAGAPRAAKDHVTRHGATGTAP